MQRRRSRVRRAQEAFRRRKEAATKSLEQRVGLLEECIEQISNQFVEFTDYLCQSTAIRQDQQLLRHSLIATSKILDLAQQANLNLNSEDGLERGRNILQGYRSALYFGIGISGLATIISLLFIRVPKDEREGWDENDTSAPPLDTTAKE